MFTYTKALLTLEGPAVLASIAALIVADTLDVIAALAASMSKAAWGTMASSAALAVTLA